MKMPTHIPTAYKTINPIRVMIKVSTRYGNTPVSAPKKPALFLGRMRRGFSSLVVKLEEQPTPVHFFGRIRSGFGSVVGELGGQRTSVRNRQRDPATGSKTQGTEPKKQPTGKKRVVP